MLLKEIEANQRSEEEFVEANKQSCKELEAAHAAHAAELDLEHKKVDLEHKKLLLEEGERKKIEEVNAQAEIHNNKELMISRLNFERKYEALKEEHQESLRTLNENHEGEKDALKDECQEKLASAMKDRQEQVDVLNKKCQVLQQKCVAEVDASRKKYEALKEEHQEELGILKDKHEHDQIKEMEKMTRYRNALVLKHENAKEVLLKGLGFQSSVLFKRLEVVDALDMKMRAGIAREQAHGEVASPQRGRALSSALYSCAL